LNSHHFRFYLLFATPTAGISGFPLAETQPTSVLQAGDTKLIATLPDTLHNVL
jgi:hypothetical protein